jgi:hypothetical protein
MGIFAFPSISTGKTEGLVFKVLEAEVGTPISANAGALAWALSHWLTYLGHQLRGLKRANAYVPPTRALRWPLLICVRDTRLT